MALYGFIAGILASNHDVTDLFVDGTLRICKRDMVAFEELLTKLDSLLEKIDVNVSMTVSMPAEEISDTIRKYRLWGLFIFVAIPLPGTGAWTGALIADLLDIRIRDAMLTISAGVLVAGLIISALSYGLFGLLGF